MDFGRYALSIPLRWTLLYKMIGTITPMALWDLAVSTSRVSPPTYTAARELLEESRDASSIQPTAAPFAFTFSFEAPPYPPSNTTHWLS
eukprot:9492630-Pyramimonas_sp.AAC.1